MTERSPSGHFTEQRQAQFWTLGTEAWTLAQEHEWSPAEAMIDANGQRELRSASTVTAVQEVRQFYTWVRQAHVVRH